MWGVTIFIFLFGVSVLAFKIVDFSRIKSNRLNKKLIWIQRNVLHDYVMQFVIGMISTIIGITLGIGITNYDTDQKDRERTLEILRFIYYDLDAQMKSLDSLHETKEKLGYATFIDEIHQRPIEHLSMLDVMLNDSNYVEIIHPTLHIQIIDIRDSIVASITRINNDKGLDEERFEDEWNLLKLYYEYMQNSVFLAMQNILGEVTNEDIVLYMNSNRFYMDLNNYINLGYSKEDAFYKAVENMVGEFENPETE